MAVQDDLPFLISSLERILWEGQISENPEVSALLERVRHYLLTSQSVAHQETYEETAEKLTQIVLTCLESRITPWLHPLQEELEQLRHQRQSLLEEIQHLEQQRQQMITDFLENLSNRFHEVWKEQLSQTQEISPSPTLDQSSNISPELSSEQLVDTLDSSLKTVFETLSQDLRAYSDSLTEGLERMHRLGQQGEAKFLAYFNRLQQQVETSLHQLTVGTSELESSEPRWYVGIDVTTQKLTTVLFRVEPDTSQESPLYPLEDIVTLPLREPSENILNDGKQVLMTLCEALATQITDQSRFLGEWSLGEIFNQLQGVMVAYPSHWNGSDRAQLQEEILKTAWVSTLEQIIWVPKAIALAFAYLPLSRSSLTSMVIDLQSTSTEVAFVETPDLFPEFVAQHFTYGTRAMDQDILCQLIYPQWYAQITQTFPHLTEPFPQPGVSDVTHRESLSQQLQNHPLGTAFLEAAQLTRLILQQQETFTSTLSQQSWGVTRQDLIEQIIQPWIEQVKEAIAILLTQTGKREKTITQIIITGEAISAVSDALSPWLIEKFSQATLIQEEDNPSTSPIFQGLIRLSSDFYRT